MQRVGVLMVTRRKGWDREAARSLKSQTFRDFQFVAVIEPGATFETYPWSPGAYMMAPSKTRKSNLNASLNVGLQALAGCDYVIFYQDFIELQPDCFEKLLALVAPDTFVTTATINADGKHDGRYLGLDCPHPCRAEEWEANVAIAPMAVIRDLGGFDEEYDNGWSWDNVNLAERAEMLGCKFVIDETNCPQLLPHDKPSKELLERPNGEFHAQRMREIRAGERPLKLTYL